MKRFFIRWLVLHLLPLVVAFPPQALAQLAIKQFAGFGQTIQQCDAAYGKAFTVSSAQVLVCPQNRGYVTGGLSIQVGFDEASRAERFVISKVTLPSAKMVDLSETEQKALLDAFADGSTWGTPHDNDNGPIWSRIDGQAYASYIVDAHYMVLLSKQGMDRHIKTLPSH